MVLYNTMLSTSSCKQWCYTIQCTPPAAASNGAVQYYASSGSCKSCDQQLQAMDAVLYNTMLHQQLQAYGAVQYHALHQQLQAMVLYNTMNSTSSCKQWCCTIPCSPPASASNGAVQYYALHLAVLQQWCCTILCLHQQLQAMVLYNTMPPPAAACNGY